MFSNLSDQQKNALERIFDAGCVFMDINTKRFFLPNGEPVHHTTARSLIDRKCIKANYDGLFGSTQSFRANFLDKTAIGR